MWPLTGIEVVNASRGLCKSNKIGSMVINGASTDSRKIGPSFLFVAIEGEKVDGHDFVAQALTAGAALALVSKTATQLQSLSPEQRDLCIEVDNVLNSFRLLAGFVRDRFPFPVIGVGGSNGKTTTKEMLAAMLTGNAFRVTKTEKSENGFLGLAITLAGSGHSISQTPHALVLEIGIDEKGAMREHLTIAKPNVVALTALGPEHLAGLDNWETAIKEELDLFYLSPNARCIWQLADKELRARISSAKAGDVFVINERDQELSSLITSRTALDNDKSTLCFRTTRQNTQSSTAHFSWWPTRNATSPSWQGSLDIPLPGEHNINNFALALATALSLGRLPREIEAGLAHFVPPAMRSRVVELPNGTTLFDDCYNASPASMEAALKVLNHSEWASRPKLLILGDMLDLGAESKKWHLALVPILRHLRGAHLCLFGNAMYDVFQELQNSSASERHALASLVHLFPDRDPCLFLEEIKYPLLEAVMLVKGSRAMDLGRVVACLEGKGRSNS